MFNDYSSKMRYIYYFLLVFTFAACSSSSAAENRLNDIEKVEVYYYGWNVMTRARLDLKAVREGRKIAYTIYSQDEITAFTKWLKIDKLRTLDHPEPEDPRLVIDLIDKKGNVISYYASYFSLLNETSSALRPIDEVFRKRFSFSSE